MHGTPPAAAAATTAVCTTAANKACARAGLAAWLPLGHALARYMPGLGVTTTPAVGDLLLPLVCAAHTSAEAHFH